MAAIAIHVVRLGQFTLDANGQRIDSSSKSAMLSGRLVSAGVDLLVIPDSSLTNSAGYPSVKLYLEREAASGYKLQHLDQTFCITYEA